jgi:hypothetical protein
MADDPRTGKAAARALPFLEQGEQLRCAAEFHVAPGVPEPPFWMVREVYPQLAPATKAGTVMAAGGYAQDVLVGNVIGRGLHGRGMAGGWRSTAGRLRIHVVANAGDLVVTDRRVLVLQPRLALKGLKPTDEMVPCWETERAEITGVRPRTGSRWRRRSAAARERPDPGRRRAVRPGARCRRRRAGGAPWPAARRPARPSPRPAGTGRGRCSGRRACPPRRARARRR